MNKKYVFFIALAIVSVFALSFNSPVEAQVTSTIYCPVGMTCTPVQTECPAGYTCTPIQTDPNCPIGFTCQVINPIITPDMPPVQVPDATVTVQGAPTLSLSYDSLRKESALVATFNIVVDGKTRGINVGYGSRISVIDPSNPKSSTYPGGTILPINPSATIQDYNGQTLYMVSPGTKVAFRVIATMKPSQMFAGTYYASLNYIYGVVGTSSMSNANASPINATNNRTNTKTIIGETSPYISSVSPNPINPGQTMTLSGQRLGNTKLMIDGVASDVVLVPVNSMNGGYGLSFKMPTLISGYHNLQLISKTTGLSNNIGFQVQGSSNCYTFSSNLAVGSTGSDVVALQTWLLSHGYDIPDISSGRTVKGYFGQSTKAAVMKLQTAYSLPSTGFVGPETRAVLNKCAEVPPVVTCPAGYICTPVGGPLPTCPSGFICTEVTLNCPPGFICTNQVPSTNISQPVVKYISPTTASSYSTINIYGSGFYNINTTIGIDGPSSFPRHSPNYISPDGTQMSVIVPDMLPGQYTITASNLINGSWVRSSGSANLTVTSTSPQSSITVLSPKAGEVVAWGKPYSIDWKANVLSSNDIFDITEIYGYGKDTIVSVPAPSVCVGPGMVTCSYSWTPAYVSSNYMIAISQNGKNTGYSGSFSVSSSTSAQSTITLSPSVYVSGVYGDSVSADAIVPVFAIDVTANSRVQLNGFSIMSDTIGISSKMSGFYINNGFGPNSNTIALNSGPIFNQNGTTQYDFSFTDVISGGTTKTYVVYAKTTANASGSFRFGIGGVSHDTTTSTAVGVGLWGQYKKIVSAVSPQPSLTVLSPNGGETYLSSGAITYYGKVIYSPKKLVAYLYSPVNGNVATNYMGSISGDFKGDFVGDPSIGAGQYKITVCDELTDSPTVPGKPLCDSSDNYFNVVPDTNVNRPPVISGGTFPVSLNVNEVGTWSINASDPENGPLSYSVDWGDTTVCPVGYNCSTLSPQTKSFTQTSTFTHSYALSGKYTVTITVKDNTGLTAQNSSNVEVGSVVTVCPVGYICTPAGSSQICPAGYSCMPVIDNCPSGYSCQTMVPVILTPTTTPTTLLSAPLSSVQSGSCSLSGDIMSSLTSGTFPPTVTGWKSRARLSGATTWKYSRVVTRTSGMTKVGSTRVSGLCSYNGSSPTAEVQSAYVVNGVDQNWSDPQIYTFDKVTLPTTTPIIKANVTNITAAIWDAIKEYYARGGQ